MKRAVTLLLLAVLLVTTSGCTPKEPAQTIPTTQAATVPTTAPLPQTVPSEAPTTAPTLPPLELTEEEQEMLLKIGMAELGSGDCTECIALVMCTVLNRVEAENRFGSTIRGVLFAQDQFTPVADGSYYKAVPNDRCREALDLVIHGWDESQGALYYEFCEGESWHSKNLNLLFQHCDTRFYN